MPQPGEGENWKRQKKEEGQTGKACRVGEGREGTFNIKLTTDGDLIFSINAAAFLSVAESARFKTY